MRAEDYHPAAPAALSVLLFILDFCFVSWALPSTPPLKCLPNVKAPGAAEGEGHMRKIAFLFSTRSLMQLVLLKCGVQLISRSMSSMEAFYVSERFQLTPAELGRLGA